MKMRRREHSHEASATGSGALPNEAIRVLTLSAARHYRAVTSKSACQGANGMDPALAAEWNLERQLR